MEVFNGSLHKTNRPGVHFINEDAEQPENYSDGYEMLYNTKYCCFLLVLNLKYDVLLASKQEAETPMMASWNRF